MEATSGFEPEIKALQASALPLGHVALNNGADDGVRTRDPNLGKVVLYQLSHVRVSVYDTKVADNCKYYLKFNKNFNELEFLC